MAKADIIFDQTQQIFHLANEKISYIMGISEGEILTHLYFGRRVSGYHGSRKYPRYERGLSPNLAGIPGKVDRMYSKDVLPQEFAGNQTGDFRSPAIIIKAANGAIATDFRYDSYEILAGKPELEGLPQTYVKDEGEAQTLAITLKDKTLQARVILYYTIFAERAVITRSTQVINDSEETFNIEKVASLQLDMPKQDMDVISFPGSQFHERQVERQTLRQGITEFGSRRGASSHHMNPFVIATDTSTTEQSGEAYGIQLVYSGNHQFTFEKDYIDQTRLVTGINEDGFSWQLQPSDKFQSPEAILVYSDAGLNGMSQAYHHLLRERVARGQYQYQDRPIVINNWEATYFDFNAKKIEGILDEAAPLGIEMFVLDDGWFGQRDDDKRSLGDWYEYTSKLADGGGLRGLAEKVHAKNMQFGLWFEPEMISENSDLYRQHPDYALQIPNRPMSLSRDQYVLDFSRPEVVENVYQQMTKILDRVPIDYIKWDMNRHMTEVYSAVLPSEQQGEVAHRYILGVYSLVERLTTRYPEILMEGCSSGGGRFDAGMLYYFPQTWTSDSTDAAERIKIQYGTTFGYPVLNMTAHVAAVPNPQTQRDMSLKTRGDVASSGVFGYELNVQELTEAEKDLVKEQVAFYKEHRHLIQFGDFYRLKSPFTGNEAAWEFVSPDGSDVLVYHFRMLASGQQPFTITKLTHLIPDGIYVDQETGERFTGDELMYVGRYDDPTQAGDYVSQVRSYYLA